VSRPSESGRPVPVRGQWVVLHRVGSDRAGPLDSVQSDAAGRFRFRYRPTGASDALYFVSATYSGIAYFSPPLRDDTVSGEDADVIVYETTTDTAKLRLQGRHFVLSAPRGPNREVVEVFEIENEGFRTVVARDTTAPIWSILLPPQARAIAVSQGDISAGAVNLRPGRADIFAPFSPGVRQLVLTYAVAADAFPLSQPIGRKTSVLEVLLEEPRANVEGANLTEVANVSIESRIFRRFLAQDPPVSAVMRVSAPAPVAPKQSTLRVLTVVMAIAMLGAFGFWLIKRRPLLTSPHPALLGTRPLPARESDRLIAELATLDAAFERSPPSAGETRLAYEQERAQLKERIARALATEKTQT
jgi:hypothetical protein